MMEKMLQEQRYIERLKAERALEDIDDLKPFVPGAVHAVLHAAALLRLSLADQYDMEPWNPDAPKGEI